MTYLTASLTLVRPGPKGPEIFWGRRRKDRSFLGGFHAFFAGSVEDQDDQFPVDDPDCEDRIFRTAALRETVEESQVYVGSNGVGLGQKTDPLAISRLHDFGWWHTPPGFKYQFVTAFYGLYLTAPEAADLDDLSDHLDRGEFDGGQWIAADDALARWRRGEVYITTPIRRIIESLASGDDHRPSPLGPTRQSSMTSSRLKLHPHLSIVALKTPTIPPSTHTNALLIGDKQFVIVDPGTGDDEQLRPLLSALDKRLEQGHRCRGIFLSHHHRDHVGGIKKVAALVDAPLIAHDETLTRVATDGLASKSIDDGQRLPIDSPTDWVALHTPGHAPGHLALWNDELALLFAADLVASQGTIIVNPPEGNMGHYLASLERTKALNPRAIIPSHGPLITDPIAHLDAYLSHRRAREEKVLHALRHHGGPASSEDLVAAVYDDAPRQVWPLATRSLLAHLEHLADQGLARRADGHFIATDEK